MKKKLQINDAFIMAAGRGVRLRPITLKIPKGMVKYKQSTLISNGIKKIKKKIKNIHVSVGYKGTILAKHVIENKVSSIINTEGKGNSWWIYNSIFKLLNKPMYVLTCDNVTNLDFNKISKDYEKLGSPPCMLIPVKPIKGLDGDYIFHKNNKVKKLSRSKIADIYCSGVQIINPMAINNLTKPSNDFKQLWFQLIKKNKLFVSNVKPKKWFTVDKVNDLKRLRNL